MEDFEDPMHINNVRARCAADEAEREMYREIDRELDPRPERTPVGMLMRALGATSDGAGETR